MPGMFKVKARKEKRIRLLEESIETHRIYWLFSDGTNNICEATITNEDDVSFLKSLLRQLEVTYSSKKQESGTKFTLNISTTDLAEKIDWRYHTLINLGYVNLREPPTGCCVIM